MMNTIIDNIEAIASEFGKDFLNDYTSLKTVYSAYYPDDAENIACLDMFLQKDMPNRILGVTNANELLGLKQELVVSGFSEENAVDYIVAFLMPLGVKCDVDDLPDQGLKSAIKRLSVSQNSESIEYGNIPWEVELPTESPIKTKWIVLGTLLVAILLVSAYFFIGIAKCNSYIGLVETGQVQAAKDLRSSFFFRLPSMDGVFEWKVRNAIKKPFKLYNKGEIDYSTASDNLSQYINSELGDYASDLAMLMDELRESKLSYSAAEDFIALGDYISAFQAFNAVIPEDENYKSVSKLQKKYADEFKSAITRSIEDSISAGDYNGAVEIAQIGGTCLADSELIGMMNTGTDCGNPLLFPIIQQVTSNFKMIESDSNNEDHSCYKINICELSDAHFLLSAEFGVAKGESVDGYSIRYYDLTTSELDKISESIYLETISGHGTIDQLSFDWDPHASRSQKEKLVYDELTQFGPSYKGELSGITAFETPDEIEHDESSSSNAFTPAVAFKIVFIELIGVVICIWIFIALFRKMFGRR